MSLTPIKISLNLNISPLHKRLKQKTKEEGKLQWAWELKPFNLDRALGFLLTIDIDREYQIRCCLMSVKFTKALQKFIYLWF